VFIEDIKNSANGRNVKSDLEKVVDTHIRKKDFLNNDEIKKPIHASKKSR